MSENKNKHIKNNNFIKVINNERTSRIKKLTELRKNNNAFPNNFKINITSDVLYKKFNNINSILDKNLVCHIAGRIINFRIMGKASFIKIKDEKGYIQIYLSADSLSLKEYKKIIHQYDLGDIIGIIGNVFKTKTGILSIYSNKCYLLTKSIRPLPNKFHGLKNQEIKYRKRYLDLIVNDKSKKIFEQRSKIIFTIRNFMNKMNFIEVETPMMQIIPGGATARPFITHHNTFNRNMYLRIAPELYLKRLIIGGFNKIFEINRNFRNEGISTQHNPEFTMMELYIAYANYNDLIIFFEKMLLYIGQKILKSNQLFFNNNEFNLSKPFNKLTMKESIIYYYPNINYRDLNNFNKLIDISNMLKVKINYNWSIGKIISSIFEEKIINKLITPTFITEYPTEISPLARRNELDISITDRFEFFVCGMEIANGFSELNDPEDQKIRFKQQMILKNEDNNNTQHHFYDKDYIEALEHGLPPTAGLGIGIDRLVMLFTNSQSIRDVILFPTLRPNE
ncbi:lysine--tRNA ligase [Enterobacteriaceae endosymbiont of Plateumaris sericea]|uniref:lysine--tRNA ligase n=1 Tax=Enterobacteriaceae endosymbiont of Plateumaris sericea TaxID=2675797 RepID=UPI0014497DD5|nr:lysine--tRNA ligase [Enterobacteriaceae endosymbiont of Plateumaris sericea]QJC29938.1 lysine--tRNA ligase [Enterobacteriaceae endosymbiont of Plateumaris sericea]